MVTLLIIKLTVILNARQRRLQSGAGPGAKQFMRATP
jgi:hypothetical protein